VHAWRIREEYQPVAALRSQRSLLKSDQVFAEKLFYFKPTVEKAQSCRDVLRHLFQHINEFDNQIGTEKVAAL